MITSETVRVLKKYAEFITVCPEVAIGLAVPRNPIIVIFNKQKKRLYQKSSGCYFTEEMEKFTDNYLKDVTGIDGVILKSKSPSCGIYDVKMYRNNESIISKKKDAGIFADGVLGRLKNFPIEDEARLEDIKIRGHFLTSIFALADFRKVCGKGGINELIKYHSRNKLLLMAYNQSVMRKMGGIIAKHNGENLETIYSEYEVLLRKLLSNKPRYTNEINALMHGFGYISKKIDDMERKGFLRVLDDYRMGKTGQSVPAALLKTFIERFEVSYLAEQTYFNRYPNEFNKVNSEEN